MAIGKAIGLDVGNVRHDGLAWKLQGDELACRRSIPHPVDLENQRPAFSLRQAGVEFGSTTGASSFLDGLAPFKNPLFIASAQSSLLLPLLLLRTLNSAGSPDGSSEHVRSAH